MNNAFELEDATIPANDGTALRTLIHHPKGVQNAPTLLQRTCYGRAGMGKLFGEWFAERGYRVIIQDCRGTGESGGELDYFLEAVDGRATADWIATQPWFNGALGTFGESYMGFTQYALATTKPPHLKAMAISMCAADRKLFWYPGNSFALELCLIYWWSQAFGIADDGWIKDPERAEAVLQKALRTLPLREADRVAVGKPVKWYRTQLEHASPDDQHWDVLNAAPLLPTLDIPTLLIGGWYDLVAPQTISDSLKLRSANAPSRLVMGPWSHLSRVMENDQEFSNEQMLAWFDTHLKGIGNTRRSSISAYLMPKIGWADIPSWPPTGTRQRCFLQPNGGLAGAVPTDSTPDLFVYDPNDPTPCPGGVSVRHECSGPRDNSAHESRADVLIYTGEVLTVDLDVAGTPQASVYVEADVADFDVFVRLCDVHPDGRSINVCDGLLRLAARKAGRVHLIELELWPTAYRFRTGHRLRVQISGGAFPVYAPNTCSGEPLGDAVTLRVANIRIHHSPECPSALTLPVTRELSSVQESQSPPVDA